MGLSLQQVRECWWLAEEEARSKVEQEIAYRRWLGRPSGTLGQAALRASELTLSLGREIERLDKARKRRRQRLGRGGCGLRQNNRETVR